MSGPAFLELAPGLTYTPDIRGMLSGVSMDGQRVTWAVYMDGRRMAATSFRTGPDGWAECIPECWQLAEAAPRRTGHVRFIGFLGVTPSALPTVAPKPIGVYVRVKKETDHA